MNTGQNVREINSTGLVRPISIAVDWLANNLYVVEEAGKRIDLISIDNQAQRVVVIDYVVNPRMVALDPIVG